MADTINNAVTIALGASLSGALYVGEKIAVGILMPAAGWDAAALTFLASVDGQNFSSVYDSSGNELTVQVAASRYIYLDPTAFVGVNQIKVRSGTSAAPVNQTAARALTLVTR
ncbi:hypothetical protein [Bradyrhizobium sp. RD5-C2]|uniref:hypothetical protein n=1 Tax=Bradyrhizobium sp. RD5-C2 TaxID=244562 RepID=UPI001CC68362|nr:hypothetical protein [Bradyrhizobium sp. RD5-C2]GIQ73197.1 hypothetical protein BraRD5C2_16350 [Bradyrhizobium sp. RD5-C2]